MLDHPAAIAETLRRIDAFVYDPRKAPFRGWHDDQPPAGTPGYRAMIQQVRSEYAEFLSAVYAAGLNGTAVQIGLGMGGASHFALRQLFRRVVTLDIDPIVVERYRSHTPQDGPDDLIIRGSSFDPASVSRVRDAARPADLAFIDGGHLFHEVKADWENFRSIVRPGGFVCFHDSVPRPARYHELQIDIFLTWLEHQPSAPKLTRIGNTLGIAYYVA